MALTNCARPECGVPIVVEAVVYAVEYDGGERYLFCSGACYHLVQKDQDALDAMRVLRALRAVPIPWHLLQDEMNVWPTT